MKFYWWQIVTAGALIVAIGGISVYAGITAQTKPSTVTQSQVTAQVYNSLKDAAPTEIAQFQNLPTVEPEPEVQKPVIQTVVPTPAPIPTEVIQEAKKTTVKPPVQVSSRGLPVDNGKGAVAYDWWTQATTYWPRGTVATVIDVHTGISFKVQRTMGTNHADVEPVTTKDSAAIKLAWGGNFGWERRPVVVVYGNYRMAAGMTSTPEGSEKITNNGVTGHMNIHFLNSRTHGSNRVDPDYQAAIKAATGN